MLGLGATKDLVEYNSTLLALFAVLSSALTLVGFNPGYNSGGDAISSELS